MKRQIFSFMVLFLITADLCLTDAQIVYEPPGKKLIDFSQHFPYIQYYIDHLADYEKGPFDGITLKLSKEAGNGNIFMVDNWEKVTTEVKEAELKLASSLKASPVLTDNFLVLFGASQMDWFSDDDWVKVEDHIRYAVHVARAAKCKGILWDAEPYKPGKNPWQYSDQEKASMHSFEEYYTQVRKRGAQFIKVLQAEFPGIVIFSLRELSDFQEGSPFSAPIFPVKDKREAMTTMKEAWWGLHIPFYVGIMDEINTETTFIDGNEEAYYYTSPLEYYKVRSTLIDDAKAIIPTDLWSKHTCSFRIGHAIAPEYYAGNWLGLQSFPYRLSGQAMMLTNEEKAKWLEHNTYFALRTSDRYAWTWAEDIDWWTGNNLLAGFTEALFSAKKKVAAGQPLGFEIGQMIKKAQDKAEEFYKDKN